MSRCEPTAFTVAVVFFSTCLLCTDLACARDATLQVGAQVPYCDVVEAVIAKFSLASIFSDDHGLLRRIAYAESAGTISPTTATGSGIWRATQQMLDASKANATSSSYKVLEPLRRAIANSTQLRTEFGQILEWDLVTYSQLRLPLYSALTVRLYVEALLESDAALSTLPLRLDKQASFWAKYFSPAAAVPSVAEQSRRSMVFVNRTRQFDDQCACNANVDMAFVMDMSGSVGASNFAKARAFASAIASSFNVGRNETRVGMVTYSTFPVLNFPFGRYNSPSSVAKAILRVPYTGGSTYTSRALRTMIHDVFMLNNTLPTTVPPIVPTTPTPAPTSSAPASTIPVPFDQGPDFPGGGGGIIPPGPSTTQGPVVLPTVAPQTVQSRVGIVITDGKSKDDVLPASLLAHGLGITVFSIGVGIGIQTSELNEIASDPDQAHVYEVGDYDVIENIRTSIRERTCRTPSSVGLENPVAGSLKENETQFIAVPLPPDEPPVVTITLSSEQGDVGFFASFDFQNPNAALHDFMGEVTSGQTEHFVVRSEGSSGGRRRRDVTAAQTTQLYMSVVGKTAGARFVLQAQSGDVAPTTTAPAKTTKPFSTASNTALATPFFILLSLLFVAVFI